MLPNSKTAANTRTIHVAAGRSHSRTIQMTGDPNDQPIVERMTRSRLNKMTAEEEADWKTSSVNKILGLTPCKADQESILNFLNKRSSEAGASASSSSDVGSSSSRQQTPLT